ncbi:hypothetical protein GGI01_000916 [Coemansia sp. RSA 376]|nr:hypothetical protein GGI01_000916 [Coemansia sp. RSA 376]
MPANSNCVVEADGQPVLNITIHEGGCKDALRAQVPVLRVGAGSETHPWHMVLTMDCSLGSNSDAFGGREGFPLQGALGDTAVSVAPHSGSSEESRPTLSIAATDTDEIETQNLLDDLDGLYDFGDVSAKARQGSQVREAIKATCDRQSADSSTADPDQMVGDQPGSNIPTRPMGLIAQPRTARPPLMPRRATGIEKTRRGDDSSNLLDDGGLGDMSDSEAMKLIGDLGGFGTKRVEGRLGGSRPSTTAAAAASVTGDDGETVHAPSIHVLPDMDDVEVRNIIQQFGGFSKSREHCTVSEGPRLSAKKGAAATPTRKALGPQTLPTPVSAAPARQASPSADSQAETAAQSPASKFPSHKDVLSARRALMADGGKPSTSAFNSPSKAPTRSSLLRKSGGASARPTTVPSPSSARQLVFRSPNLKRPLARPAFSTPTKRALVDGGGKSACVGSEKEDVAQHATRPSPYQPRTPATLPPVTVRQPSIQPKSGKHGEPQVFDLTRPTARHTLGSVASQIGVGDTQRLPQGVLTMSADLAAEYRFMDKASNQLWGAAEARQVLLDRGCASSVVTDVWVANHYRWSVWSCACYARQLPLHWRSFWSIGSIVNRLLYRYEREYVCGQRSALRRVLEGDSSSQQLMVLCVASVLRTDKAAQAEVTDGWYGIQAVLDPVLAQALSKGKLRVGDKIACVGLRMSGVAEGVPPLTEKAEHARLMLNGNCVRRAPWDAKLGFQRRKAMFLSLSAVSELGGAVGAALDVVVMRSYPVLYMETLSDGRRVIRSEREELRVSGALAAKRAAVTQDLKERAIMARSKSANGVRLATSSIEACHEGKELYDYVMRSSADPAEAQRQLTRAQAEALDRYAAEQQAAIEADVAETVDKQAPQRQVRALFKLLVCDYPAHKCKQAEPSGGQQLALVTVWGPRGIGPADFAEGSRFLFTGLTVSPRKTGWQQMRPHHQDACLRLNFSLPGSHFKPMPVDPEIIQRSEYRKRGTLYIDEMCHISPGQEVDLAGTVTACQAAAAAGQSSVLHLSTVDERGTSHVATVEFPVVTFGSVNVASGCQATVRNCVYAPRAGAAPNTFHLRAGDGCELIY